MSKFNIGDRVVIADPAYLIATTDLQGYVDPEFYGKTGVVKRVEEEDDTFDLIGTAYDVEADGKRYSQTISQRYLSAAPDPEPAPEPIADGVYREKDDEYADTVLIKDGKVVEVLIAGDGCKDPAGLADHLRWFQSDFSADKIVRLVAPKVEKPVLADGIYVDSSGDIVQIKDGKHRDLQTAHGAVLDAEYLEEPDYGPYTLVVTETEAAAK